MKKKLKRIALVMLCIGLAIGGTPTSKVQAGAKNSKGQVVHDKSYLPDIVAKYGTEKNGKVIFKNWDTYVKAMGEWISTRALEFYNTKYTDGTWTKKKGQGILPSAIFAQAMCESCLGTDGSRYHTVRDIFGVTASGRSFKDWDEDIDFYMKNFVCTQAKFYDKIWKAKSWQEQIVYQGGGAYCADPAPSTGTYVARLYTHIKAYGAYKLDNCIKNKYSKIKVVNSHDDVFELYEKVTGYKESNMGSEYKNAKAKEQKETHKVFDGDFEVGVNTTTEQQDANTELEKAGGFVSTVDNYEAHTLDENYTEISTMSDLSVEERMQVSEIQDYVNNRNAEKSGRWITNIRVATMLFGLLIIVYTLVLFLAYWFDRFNGIFEIQLLSLVSFGKFITLDDDVFGSDNQRGSCKAINMQGSLKILIIGVLAGIFILSGKLFSTINFLYNIITKI